MEDHGPIDERWTEETSDLLRSAADYAVDYLQTPQLGRQDAEQQQHCASEEPGTGAGSLLRGRRLAAGAPGEIQNEIRAANTAQQALQICSERGVVITDDVARRAQEVATDVLRGAPVRLPH